MSKPTRTIYDLDALVDDDTSVDLSKLHGEYYETRKQYRLANPARQRRGRSGRGGVKATLLDKPICAIDGEGKTRPNGRHDYTLLCAKWPTGERCIEAHHLTTERCLDFIMELPDDHVYLGYGLSYDTNMWLRDAPDGFVDKLLDRGKWRYRQYEIEWVERKYMTIRAYGKSRTVYDVLAFFQVPFVSPDPRIVKGACDAWLPEFPEELEVVRVMKEMRGRFQNVEDARIKQYTYIECDLLIRLMTKFIAALKLTELRPSALYGPGALASAQLTKSGVKRFMATLPDNLQTLARVAYFGGRFDAAIFGWLSECFQFDIHSAYPHQIRMLPCLKCSSFQYHKRLFDTLNPAAYGLYHVEWRIAEEARWGPFPHRTNNGLIFYPYEGAGWYHADEVRAAIEMFGSDAINVLEGWELVTNCDHKPFDFVVSLYALRQHLETIGNHDQGVVIKLILNSLYGKLAQQVGHNKSKPPPFQCFFWAGAITAGTRAQILRVLAMDPDKVVSIATDGVVATEDLDIALSDELGDWERKPLESFAQLSNGVYHAVDTSGKHIDRARGLGRGVLDFDKSGRLYKTWKRTKGMGVFYYKGRTRFVTLREARQRGNRHEIKCRWLDEDRSLAFEPKRRFPWPTRELTRFDRLETRLLSYSDYDADRESQPFRLKTTWTEVNQKRDEFQGTNWYDAA